MTLSGDGSGYLTLLGLQRSRLTLTEGLKRLVGDRKGIGFPLLRLMPFSKRSDRPNCIVQYFAQSFPSLFAFAQSSPPASTLKSDGAFVLAWALKPS
jgi:hypothetical protein